MRCSDCGLPLDGSAGVPCTCPLGLSGFGDDAPPQGYLWPDGYYYAAPPPEQPKPYYAQPSWWADTVIRQALAPAPAVGPVVVVQEEDPTPWLGLALGVVAVIVVIRALE